MRKVILAATAIAALAIAALAPALASADVQRYQVATFTVTQPAGQVGQWNNVWTHNYTVTYNPSDGTFTGPGHVSGQDQNGPFQSDETINGSYANGKISFTATRTVDGVSWTLAGAPTDGKTVTLASTDPAVSWPIEAKVTPLQISNYKNHGDYVSSQGGGADAAQSLIGMPINSSK
jgi:hypothetical protein